MLYWRCRLYAVIVFDFRIENPAVGTGTGTGTCTTSVGVTTEMMDAYPPPLPVTAGSESLMQIAPTQPPLTIRYPVPSSPVLPPPYRKQLPQQEQEADENEDEDDYTRRCPRSPSIATAVPHSPRDCGLCPRQPPPTLVLRCQSPILPPPMLDDDRFGGWPHSPLNRPTPTSPRSTDFIAGGLGCVVSCDSDNNSGTGVSSDTNDDNSVNDRDPLYILAYKMSGSREAFYQLSEEAQEDLLGDAFGELNP